MLPTIRLGKGKGAPGQSACWMSALSQWLDVRWTDNLECVDPKIRSLCIWINDAISTDAERERLIMPHLLDPIGTSTTDDKIIEERSRLVQTTLEGPLYDLLAPLAYPLDDCDLPVTYEDKVMHLNGFLTTRFNDFIVALDLLPSSGANREKYTDMAIEVIIIPLVVAMCKVGAPERPACAIPLDDWQKVCGGA